MIDPQVEHGGASSWLWIAAPANPPFGRIGFRPSAFGPSNSIGSSTGSAMFTPASNCACLDMNLVDIHRKM